MKKRKTVYWKIWAILLLLILAGAALSFFPSVCDWYALHIYTHIAEGLGRLTAGIPFPLGEILMYLGIVFVLFSVIFLILLIFLHRRKGYRGFAKGWYKTVLMAFTLIGVLYAYNWLIPFRGTLLGKNVRTDKAYTYEQVYQFREYVYTELNAAAEQVPFDADGHVIFPDEQERGEKLRAAMHAMSDEYPLLAGYLPPVKTSLCSDLLDRMGIGGFTYPFTTEATHVRYSLSPVYQPPLDAHELCHHLGYYKENEADFLAELALSKSDDPFIRFCGFCEMSRKADLAYEEALVPIIEKLKAEGVLPDPKDGMKAYIQALIAHLPPVTEPTERVNIICMESSGVLADMVKDDVRPLDDMPQIEEAVQTISDTGWDVQADVLGENVYDGAVALLLDYFDGKLY